LGNKKVEANFKVKEKKEKKEKNPLAQKKAFSFTIFGKAVLDGKFGEKSSRHNWSL
jgi:hypothetical protein